MSHSKNPIKTVLLRLDDNFTNIEEIYYDEKIQWLYLNKGKSELDFVDAFDFTEGYDIDTIDKSSFTEIELANLSKLSTYLGKYRGEIQRTLADYYKQYLRSKRFGFVFSKKYKKKEFSELKNILDDFKLKYDYILEELPHDGKIELKNDFCDQLKRLIDLQEHSKFKEVISDAIKTIDYEYFIQKKKLQDPNQDKPTVIRLKHSHIFRNNAYDVWKSMFDSFDINEKSRTNVKFIYEEMKKDGLIFPTVSQKTFLEWISQNYEITILKTSNHSRTVERIAIYSNAKQQYKA